MFTVKRVEMVNKTFRMSVDLVQRLSIVAQQQDVSMNNLVTQCCEYALDNMSAKDSRGGGGGITTKQQILTEKFLKIKNFL